MGSQGVLLSQDKRWRRVVPASSFEVDRSHPLASGLIFLWLPAASPVPQLGCPGSPVYGAFTANGKGTNWGAGSDYRRYVLVPAGSPLANGRFAYPASIAVVGRMSSYANAGAGTTTGLVAGLTDVGPFVGLAFNTSTTTATMSYGTGTSFGSVAFGSSGADALANVLGNHVFIGTIRDGEQILYRDGVRVNSATNSVPSAPTMANPNVTLHFYPGATARAITNTNTLVAFWNRILSANEAAEMSADPFCFLRY